MMRIAELLENLTPYGSLLPAEYTAVAQQRDAALKQKRQTAQKARQQQQKLRQQQAWGRSRFTKPKLIKLKPMKRRGVKHRTRAA
jgi:ATPase subunit of ABC transporter with duplicated ATPase domains